MESCDAEPGVNRPGGTGRRISAQVVCTAIRDDIVGGFFPPGSRLAEELLARRYGVSRVRRICRH